MQFVTKGQVIVAMLPQHYPGKANGSAWIDRSRIKRPDVRRKKPRPSERFASRHGIDNDGFPIARLFLKGHTSRLNQIKSVGRLAFAKDDLAPVEFGRHRAKSQQLDVMPAHALEEWMRRQPLFDVRITNRMRLTPELIRFAFR